jgi:hypothetical protein
MKVNGQLQAPAVLTLPDEITSGTSGYRVPHVNWNKKITSSSCGGGLEYFVRNPCDS